jgi:hypothetical protein
MPLAPQRKRIARKGQDGNKSIPLQPLAFLVSWTSASLLLTFPWGLNPVWTGHWTGVSARGWGSCRFTTYLRNPPDLLITLKAWNVWERNIKRILIKFTKKNPRGGCNVRLEDFLGKSDSRENREIPSWENLDLYKTQMGKFWFSLTSWRKPIIHGKGK